MNPTSIPPNTSSPTHHPDRPPHPDAGPATDTGRGPDGRFAKGNKGGPGNPFARQVAALRQAFVATVTADDLAAIGQAMIEKARQGDVAAARLVFSYSLGKPVAAVDPDRLDELEWQQWTREEMTSTSHEVFTGLHASAANVIARHLVPVMQVEHMTELQRQLDEREEQRREEQEEDEEDEREAAREAPRSSAQVERQRVPASPASAPRNGQGAPAPVPATVDESNEARPGPGVSPIDMQKDDEGGQPAPRTARQRDAERVLRMLDATVNKRPQTVDRAANDFTD